LIPRSPEERESGYQAAHHIILNVHVSDVSGKSTAGLNQGDVTLLVDDKPRAITRFQSVKGGSPIALSQVILVLDTINNSAGKLAHFYREIQKYLAEGNGELAYPTSIAVVSESGVSVSPPSRDRATLEATVSALKSRLHSTDCADAEGSDQRYLPFTTKSTPRDPNRELDCVDQQFTASVKALNSLAEQQGNAHIPAILIWIGQGWPLLYQKGFKPDTPSIKHTFFKDLVNISSGLIEAQATLYAIASPDEERLDPHDSAFFDGVPNENEVSTGSLSLHAVAHQSGGRILKNTKDVAQQIKDCIADAASSYVLSFDSPPAAGFGEYHSLKVKVGDPKLQVRTNTLYYAEQ